MSTNGITLFKAIGAKMDFLNQRQRVISQNVANSDTPNYQPKDLVPVDFSRVLENVDKGPKQSVKIGATHSRHMPAVNNITDPKSRDQKDTYEVAPAGNAVVMEEQLMKAGETVMDYNLMTNLYQKHIRMIQTALGTQS